jgi:hypothetical protein
VGVLVTPPSLITAAAPMAASPGAASPTEPQPVLHRAEPTPREPHPARPMFATPPQAPDPTQHGVLNAPPLPPQLHPAVREPAIAEVRPPAPGQADPVVHVTIGRLEIRATSTPAERPSRPTSGPKVLSLEDYGAQRGRFR